MKTKGVDKSQGRLRRRWAAVDPTVSHCALLTLPTNVADSQCVQTATFSKAVLTCWADLTDVILVASLCIRSYIIRYVISTWDRGQTSWTYFPNENSLIYGTTTTATCISATCATIALSTAATIIAASTADYI